jgi:lysophospholipase L1-like esterase/isopentenyldiphosphate isomerase
MKVVCIFGDSVTWGARLPFRIAWANLLRNHLEKVSDNLISLYDTGIDGNNTRDVLERFEVEAKARQPDVIMFAVGVNDSLYRKTENNPEVPISEYKSNMVELITKAKKFTDNILLIGLVKGSDKWTMPLVQSTTGKTYTKARVKEYDDVLKTVAEENGVKYLELMSMLDDEDFDDGLHPNLTGHAKIFNRVKLVIDQLLDLKAESEYILVDENDNEVGTKLKEAVGSQDLVRVSAMWITNSSGQILIARRPTTKRRDPNRWAPAAAQVLEKGQSYDSAVNQVIQNELGINGINYRKEKKLLVEGYNRFFVQLYRAELDIKIEDLILNNEEVVEVKWIERNVLEKQVADKPFMFVQDFERYLRACA